MALSSGFGRSAKTCGAEYSCKMSCMAHRDRHRSGDPRSIAVGCCGCRLARPCQGLLLADTAASRRRRGPPLHTVAQRRVQSFTAVALPKPPFPSVHLPPPPPPTAAYRCLPPYSSTHRRRCFCSKSPFCSMSPCCGMSPFCGVSPLVARRPCAQAFPCHCGRPPICLSTANRPAPAHLPPTARMPAVVIRPHTSPAAYEAGSECQNIAAAEGCAREGDHVDGRRMAGARSAEADGFLQ